MSPTPPAMRRDRKIPVRFSRVELDLLRAEAKRRGMTLSAFVRALLFVEHLKTKAGA